jgi:hypothetical protein
MLNFLDVFIKEKVIEINLYIKKAVFHLSTIFQQHLKVVILYQ